VNQIAVKKYNCNIYVPTKPRRTLINLLEKFYCIKIRLELGMLVFVERGKLENPEEKRKEEKTLGTWMRTNNKCNQLMMLYPGF